MSQNSGPSNGVRIAGAVGGGVGGAALGVKAAMIAAPALLALGPFAVVGLAALVKAGSILGAMHGYNNPTFGLTQGISGASDFNSLAKK